MAEGRQRDGTESAERMEGIERLFHSLRLLQPDGLTPLEPARPDMNPVCHCLLATGLKPVACPQVAQVDARMFEDAKGVAAENLLFVRF